MGWTAEGSEFQVPVGVRFFSPPHHPDQFWGPHSLLHNGYWRAVSLRVQQQGYEDDHSHLVSRLRIVELYFHFSIHLHGVVLNKVSPKMLPYSCVYHPHNLCTQLWSIIQYFISATCFDDIGHH
jgi:hypothetical protein